jgi:hypothetical protein
MRAVTIGGVATSLSATELMGLWTPPDSALHVAVPYEMVMFDWPETLRVILSRVRRREHLWSRRSKSGKTASRRAKTHDEDGSS